MKSIQITKPRANGQSRLDQPSLPANPITRSSTNEATPTSGANKRFSARNPSAPSQQRTNREHVAGWPLILVVTMLALVLGTYRGRLYSKEDPVVTIWITACTGLVYVAYDVYRLASGGRFSLGRQQLRHFHFEVVAAVIMSFSLATHFGEVILPTSRGIVASHEPLDIRLAAAQRVLDDQMDAASALQVSHLDTDVQAILSGRSRLNPEDRAKVLAFACRVYALWPSQPEADSRFILIAKQFRRLVDEAASGEYWERTVRSADLAVDSLVTLLDRRRHPTLYQEVYSQLDAVLARKQEALGAMGYGDKAAAVADLREEWKRQ